ncbi:hypothetical protein EG68_01197, partial [Paragonimus skrjabini miyazakii]
LYNKCSKKKFFPGHFVSLLQCTHNTRTHLKLTAQKQSQANVLTKDFRRMTSQTKEATNEGLRKLFMMLDTNNDQKITGTELKSGLKSFGFMDKHIQEFLNIADLNKDGDISFSEYKKAFNLPDDSQSIWGGQVEDQALLCLFHQLDVNKDGKVTKDELQNGMANLGISSNVTAELLKHLDLNEDGFITLNEYRVGMGLTRDPVTDWKKLFDSLDKDKSGDISVNELKIVFDRIGVPIMNSGMMQWINTHDKNKDGKLNYQEFLSFVNQEVKRNV